MSADRSVGHRRRASGIALVVALVTACGSTAEVSHTAVGNGTGNESLSVPSTGTIAPGGGQSLPPGVVSSVRPGAVSTGGPIVSAGGGATSPGAVGGAGPSHAPLKVGFMYSLNDAAQAAGVNNNQTVTLGSVMHALVASYNSAGGIGGRHIDPVYRELKSSSNNFESDLAAACAAFTQDAHVAAVVTEVGLYSDSFYTCLARAGVPVISGDAGPDLHDAQAFPLLVTPDELLGDTRVVEVVTRLQAAGFLSRNDRMGVVIEDCAINHRIFDTSLKPALQRAGIAVAATAQPQCFQGISDLGTISEQMGSAVVQFRQSQVTKVMFVSQGEEGTMAYEFMLAAGNQGWYPGYALSSASFATTLQAQGGVPEQTFSNARGVGWIPPVDTVDLKQAPPTSTAKTCLARVRSQGLQPSTANDFLATEGVCDLFVLYDATLKATHGDASPAAVRRSVTAAGNGMVGALTVGGATSTWDHGRLGAAEGRLFGYVSSRGGFVYTSDPFRF